MTTRGPLWKVSVTTTTEAEEAVTELLYNFFELPVSSYTDIETDKVTVATYLTRERRRPAGQLQTESGILASGTLALPGLREGLKQIQNCGLNLGSGKVSIQKIRREDWAESWKRHFKPIEIDRALLIKPSWSKRPPRKNQAVIVLDPGLSFGTGQHPTTSFCLGALVKRRFDFPISSSKLKRRISKRNSTLAPLSSVALAKEDRPLGARKRSEGGSPLSLLDIGTGSGILAIAAAKLGYAPVDAFDFDPEAVRIARENARKNRVLHKIHITRGDVTKLALRRHKQYDLICANLISTLLVAERSRILCRLKDNGVLVLAGILKIEFASVQRAYEDAGMRLIASRAEKEWRSGAFTYRRQR